MRKKLAALCAQHITIHATYICTNEVTLRGREPCHSMLLRTVLDDVGDMLTEHAWIRLRNVDDVLGFEEGDVITLSVEVQAYIKGRKRDRHVDYQFVRPHGICKVVVEEAG